MGETTALVAHEEPRGALQTAFEPSSFDELFRTCKVLFASGLLPKAVTKVEAAVYIALRGRELGLSIGQSFASINVIDGKTTMSADLIVSRVKRSPACAVWRIDVCTAEECTITAQRAGDEKPTTLSWTIADAKRAGLLNKQNWQNYPRAMLRARVSVELARALFPEAALGLYDPDELTAQPSANDNRGPANDNRDELVGEVVSSATEPLPTPAAPPATRKASDVAREFADRMRQCESPAELDGIWDTARQLGFRESMLDALAKVWTDCRAQLTALGG